MHSRMFEKIKKWYNDGVWSAKRVHDAVIMGKITQEECDEILGVNDNG